MSTSTIPNSVRILPSTVIEDPIQVGPGCVIQASSIGRYTFINSNTCIFGDVHIGRFVTFARNCQIGGVEHPIHYLSTSFFRISRHWFPDDPLAQNASPIKETERAEKIRGQTVHIGSDVWFGAAAIVLRGTSIGHGSVIGAGAVVTKDIPPYAIVAGNPAKLIRYRFDEDICKRLLATAWWDRAPDFIATLPLNDVENCLKILENTRN